MIRYECELTAAVAAVRQAAAVCSAVQADNPEAVSKDDLSPVTVADFASQAVICHALFQAFPLDPLD